MKEGICRPKRETAELAKVRMCYASVSTEEGTVLNILTLI